MSKKALVPLHLHTEDQAYEAIYLLASYHLWILGSGEGPPTVQLYLSAEALQADLKKAGSPLHASFASQERVANVAETLNALNALMRQTGHVLSTVGETVSQLTLSAVSEFQSEYEGILKAYASLSEAEEDKTESEVSSTPD